MSYEIKGMSYAYMSRRGDLKTDISRQSLLLLKEDNVNWISLCVVQRVETVKDLTIRYNYNNNLTDTELIEFIKFAHENGFKICLKPMINSDDGRWRAEINFFDDHGSWAKWFYEYTGFMAHYAEIAEYTGVEMLCLGCEMLGTERREEEWRHLIKVVRDNYRGKLTYNTNHGHEFEAKWYDEVDYLGTSAYFRMRKKDQSGGNLIMDLTYEDMLYSWSQVKEEMRNFSLKYNKPIIFMEIGLRSAKGCASQPWDFKMRELPYDEEEQALFYKSAMETFKDEDFMRGFFWWDWPVWIAKTGMREKDTGFCIYKKEAERVLKEYYSL